MILAPAIGIDADRHGHRDRHVPFLANLYVGGVEAK